MRTLMYLATLLVLTPLWGTAVIVAALLGVKRRPGGVYDQATLRWSRALLRAAGTPVATVGLEHVRVDRSAVYVSNHQSWFDILALAATLPETLRFVAKKEMASIPLLGRAMKAAGHIFIDRQNRGKAFEAYDDAAASIRAGLSAVVFPEGTRSRTGELQPFKKGPFVLAIAAQVPIIPVYCANTFDILPKASLRIRPRPITLYFGSPIDTTGLTYEDRTVLLDRCHEAIEGLRDRFQNDSQVTHEEARV